MLNLANLHGDIVATAVPTDTGPATYSETTEYGVHRAPAGANRRYGWLGTHHRNTGDTLAQLTLMGVHLFNPTTGRFLSVDPVTGGSCNDYDYACADPINALDLDGRWISILSRGCRLVCKPAYRAGVRSVERFSSYVGRRLGQANRSAKEWTGSWLSNRFNGGRHRVTITGRGGWTHYDLQGRAHGGVRTPHKTWQPRNPRAPHGWGKTGRKATSMGWRDLGRVGWYLIRHR